MAGVIKMTEREYLSMFKDEPEVLTVPEVAKMLRIGKNKTYDIVREGRLRTVKVGGKFLVPKLRVIEFLMEQTS